MATKKDMPEVNVELITRKPVTGEITRRTKTFRADSLEAARKDAARAVRNPDDFVKINQGETEYWVKGLELVHD